MLRTTRSPARREADHAFAVSRETWQQMHAVNLDAGFHLARELARSLIAAPEPGSFLFLTSLHGGMPRFGIRVNAPVPGAIAAGAPHPEVVMPGLD